MIVFNSYNDFNKDYSELLEYFSYYQSVDEQLLSRTYFGWKHSDSTSSMIRKRFRYEFLIMSIYGMLERAIENIIEEYVYWLNRSIKDYSNLPSMIQNKYHHLAIGYISNRYLFKDDSIIEYQNVINSVSSILTKQTSDYFLHEKAFSFHNSNLRINILVELFSNIGITNCEQSIFNYLKDRQEQFAITNYHTNYIAKFLDNLVQRRNEIAHGNKSALDELLDLNECKRYLKHIKGIIDALHSICLSELLGIIFSSKMPVEIGCANRVFPHHNAFKFKKGNLKLNIFKTQKVYLKFDNVILEDEILRIESDYNSIRTEYTEININDIDSNFYCTLELLRNKDVSKLAKYTFYLRE